MIDQEPDFYYWPYNLGISYMAIGKNDLGIKYLKKSYDEKLHVNIKAAILNLLGGIYKTEERWEELEPVVEKSTKMVKKEENIRSESYYPDSTYYLDQDNIHKEAPLSEEQISNKTKFEWPDSYWFVAERTNGRLAMIGFMAVIINYTLFGWIAYPIL